MSGSKESTPIIHAFLAAVVIGVVPAFLIGTLVSLFFDWSLSIRDYLWAVASIAFVFFVNWIIGLSENVNRLKARVAELEKDITDLY